ncbi:MAG: glycine C-acetyltransferase [Fidelibacterota bacterium]
MKDVIGILVKELDRIHKTKTFKKETPLESQQDAVVKVEGEDVIMLASNNYLGLSSHPRIKRAAIRGIEKFGHGVASVRFICGTQTVHKELEERIASFLGAEDAILFMSCFSANEGLFASLVNEKLEYENYTDVIYSDRLNHASIIDGMRLCNPRTTEKKIYPHTDTESLRNMLNEDKNKNYRFRIIATDGVFSMEGDLAPLDELVVISEEYDAILVVDDSHAVGVLGKGGRGTPEELHVFGKVDLQTGTLGKALGGAAGGYIAGKKDIITYLRQKSRPYTFSNSLPPPIVCAAIEAINILEEDASLVEKLRENTIYFRSKLKDMGFTIIDGIHPIIPIMLGEAPITMLMSEELLKQGVYIKGLWYPVVPEGEARLRAQISAVLEMREMDKALNAFYNVGKKLGVLNSKKL